MQTTKERRSAHQTQWAAQFAVASELCKRNYEVALTMGNHPVVDLMVISPGGTPFLVDVKGLYKRNYWPVRKRDKVNRKLFYIFALVPEDAQNQFFILTHSQVNAGIRANVERNRMRHAAKGLTLDESNYFYGVNWGFAQKYGNKWGVLPK